MNAERRKRLSAALEQLEAAKFEIEEIQQEEQEAYDNMPESLQESERGETIANNAESLENAMGSLD